MGGVVSAIARRLLKNIKRDFIKQLSPSRDKPKARFAVKQDDKFVKKTRQQEPASLSDLRIIGTPVKHENYLDKQNKNKEKKDQSSSVSNRSKDGDISASSYSGQTDAEDFFQDFLSSLETTCLIQEHKCSGNENISLSKNIGPHLEGGPKDTITLTDYEDSFLPIINLLPRLTKDLAA